MKIDINITNENPKEFKIEANQFIENADLTIIANKEKTKLLFKMENSFSYTLDNENVEKLFFLLGKYLATTKI